jgi:hypothetical protein
MGLDCHPVDDDGSEGSTPSELGSSREDDDEEDKDGEDGEITPPPHSLSREPLPLLG